MPIYNHSEVQHANPEIMKHQTTREYVNDLEPKVSAVSLGATLASAIPFTAPIAVPVAIASNIAGAGIDGYQTYDDLKNGDYSNAAQNALSAVLSLYGAKAGTNFLQSANGKKILLSKETADKLIHNVQKKYNKVISSNYFLPVLPDINDLVQYYKDKREQKQEKDNQ